MPGIVLSLLLIFSPFGASRLNQSSPQTQKQLFAVRGQIVSVKSHSKGMLFIAIKPAGGFAEVSVIARENDLVGKAVGGAGDRDLFGLLTGDASEDETITAAELGEGDTVSVIYDPQLQNRVIEIYLH